MIDSGLMAMHAKPLRCTSFGMYRVYVSWLSNVQHQPLTQLSLAWLGLRARLGSARLGLARLGSARLGSARLGSARLGSARLGSARLGLAWLGLSKAWLGWLG